MEVVRRLLKIPANGATMGIENDQAKLSAAVRRLLSEFSKGEGRQRTQFAWVLREHAVLTADLHTIAAEATAFLSKPEQKQHAMARWQITYVSDGATFVAAAPE